MTDKSGANNHKAELTVEQMIDNAHDNYMRGNIDATTRDYLIEKAKRAAAPAAQAADDPSASPKHDEGREIVPVRSERRVDGGFYVVAGPYDNPRTHGEAVTAIRAALATQTAARRVTDEDVERAERARVKRLNALVAYGSAGVEERHSMAMRAALESFAQSGAGSSSTSSDLAAEGVSRKKHDGPCWRNSHADCGC